LDSIINDETFKGLGFLVWCIFFVSGIDYVLRPIIQKKLGNLHPVISILGVLIGIPMFGIPGIVFGPLLFSFFLLSIKIFFEIKGQNPTS